MALTCHSAFLILVVRFIILGRLAFIAPSTGKDAATRSLAVPGHDLGDTSGALCVGRTSGLSGGV
jgi:hypothetical protein